MSSRTLRHAVKKREYKERAQPTARQRLGLLEKKKDYKERAKDYHSKEDRIKKLREKAALRNQDEFYFGMVNSQTKDGIHQVKRGKKRTFDEISQIKEQDMVYYTSVGSSEAKKIERLRSSLQLVTDENVAKTAGRQHVIFKDTETEAKEFDAAEHFDTVSELVSKPTARLRREQLEKEGVLVSKSHPGQLAAADRAQANAYRELMQRVTRSEEINQAAKKIRTQKQLMGKGRRVKIVAKDIFGDEIKGKTTYKWKFQRK